MKKPVTSNLDKFLKEVETNKLGEVMTPVQKGYGKNGWSDRILFTHGFTFFLEIKEKGDKERPLQALMRKKLQSQFFQWVVVTPDNVEVIKSQLTEKIVDCVRQVEQVHAMQQAADNAKPVGDMSDYQPSIIMPPHGKVN